MEHVLMVLSTFTSTVAATKASWEMSPAHPSLGSLHYATKYVDVSRGSGEIADSLKADAPHLVIGEEGGAAAARGNGSQ